ncbi:hypothetical protein RSAG8_00526, partial [Rhizoctonia solani AG-8 WAC10335]
ITVKINRLTLLAYYKNLERPSALFTCNLEITAASSALPMPNAQ